jgi:hypothetical protein
MLLTWVGFVESLKKNSQKKNTTVATAPPRLTRVIADKLSVMLAAMYINASHGMRGEEAPTNAARPKKNKNNMVVNNASHGIRGEEAPKKEKKSSETLLQILPWGEGGCEREGDRQQGQGRHEPVVE